MRGAETTAFDSCEVVGFDDIEQGCAVRSSGRTPGELGLLFSHEGQRLLREVAVKFYLSVPALDQEPYARFQGPVIAAKATASSSEPQCSPQVIHPKPAFIPA